MYQRTRVLPGANEWCDYSTDQFDVVNCHSLHPFQSSPQAGLLGARGQRVHILSEGHLLDSLQAYIRILTCTPNVVSNGTRKETSSGLPVLQFSFALLEPLKRGEKVGEHWELGDKPALSRAEYQTHHFETAHSISTKPS